MGSLAVLGDMPFHRLSVVTLVSEPTHRRFFELFCKVGETMMFNNWVRPPMTESDLRSYAISYTNEGLSGAFASTDCIKIRLWSVSYSLRNFHIGKESYPTRVFQVSVVYNGYIFACTEGWSGRDPDVVIIAQ